MKKLQTVLVMALAVLFAVNSTSCSLNPGAGSSRNTETGYSSPATGMSLVRAPFYPGSDMPYEIEAPKNFDWKQFNGTTLNFLVENNIYANVLTKESEQFTKITGINVNIRPMDFSTLMQKLNLDFISKTGKYQIIYADPHQTLNRFADNFEDLNNYEQDPLLPHIPGGMEDFYEKQADTDSYFINRDKLVTIPFDSTTMILFYRKDIFEKYKNKFMAEKGYDWTPGQDSFTWERYSEVAQWITDNVPKSEVKYGSGHMAKKHNSLYCDFSNVLAAYGGDYFKDANVGGLGLREAVQPGFGEPNFIAALDMYRKIIATAAPESKTWDWSNTAEAFKAGELAMMPNWDENSSSLEDGNTSKVAGKVGYSILPRGTVRSANIFGGTGIGINRHSTEKEKQAAWLFLIWATSPQTELLVLKHPEGGVVPSRKSVVQSRDVQTIMEEAGGASQENGIMASLPAVLNAWKNENIYYRPKVGNGYYIENIIITQLHRMIDDQVDAREIAETMLKQVQELKQ